MNAIKYLIALSLLTMIGCKRNNELKLTFSEQIEKYDVKIELEVKHTIPKTIIYALGHQKSVPNEYGENDWTITYKDSLAGHFRHIKTNRNDTHKYSFKIYQRDTSVLVDISIKGISELNKTIILTTSK